MEYKKEFQEEKEQNDIHAALNVVEETWGNLAIDDKEFVKYVAEDKKLEYDV